MFQVKSDTFGKIEEKVADANLKIYESARAEIIQRILIRDSALGLYIATVGSYLVAILRIHYSSDPDKIDIGYACVSLLPFPVVCGAFSLIIIQHHLVIGRLGAFIRFELDWGNLKGRVSKNWDNSQSFLSQASYLIVLRLFAQALVLCLPFAYSIFFYSRFYSAAQSAGGYWSDIIALQLILNIGTGASIVWLHLYAHYARTSEWEKQDR